MRKAHVFIMVMLLLWGLSTSRLAGAGKSLADFYRTGKIRFNSELTIDETSLPKDVFLEMVSYLAFDSLGNVYIVDSQAKNIKKFDAAGKFIKAIGRQGQGPGEFAYPYLGAVTQDRLIVWDFMSQRFPLFSLDGEFIKAVQHSRENGSPKGMKALPDGNIVLELEKTNFQDFNKPQDCLIWIYSPEMMPVKILYTHPVLRNKYMRIENSLTNIPQPFSPSVHWEVLAGGNLVIGFSDKYELEIYSPGSGKTALFTRPFEPVKVTDEDKKAFFDGMSYSRGGTVSRGAPDHIVKNTEFPRNKPAFDRVLTDPEGNILLHLPRASKEDESRLFDAFAPDGKFIATVRIEGDAPSFFSLFLDVNARAFWCPKAADDGTYRVVKYKIAEAE